MAIKRKEVEEVNDGFSEFYFSSPATKIPRLDAEMAPIMVEEEMAVPFDSPAEQFYGRTEQARNSGPVIEELPSEPENFERALVVFKPMDNPLVQTPSSLTISVDHQLISRVNNKMWSTKSTAMESRKDSDTGNECLAVVPWAPSKIPPAPETKVSELTDADDMGVDSMDIEEEKVAVDNGHVYNSVPIPGEHLHQWQQQHCFVPQLPQNTSAPIMWFR